MSLELCAVEIKVLLLKANANATTSYDMSHLVLKTDKGESIRFIGTDLCEPSFSNPDMYEDDEQEYEQPKKMKKCRKKIKDLLSDYDYVLESTYDTSHVYIYDRYGNREKI